MSATLYNVLSGLYTAASNIDINFKNYDRQLSTLLEANEIVNSDIEIDPSQIINAMIWSEGTDAEVQELGGQHSAKGWAELMMPAASALQEYISLASALNEALSAYNADNNEY